QSPRRGLQLHVHEALNSQQVRQRHAARALLGQGQRATWVGSGPCGDLLSVGVADAELHQIVDHLRSVFLILPVVVLCRSGPQAMLFGPMKLPNRFWPSFWSSFSVRSTPFSRTTKALTACPKSASGTPITAASLTPLTFISALSTSFGATFSPRDLMMSSI